ncbi:MAG: nitrous oxide reductase accessory protein NosL [Cryomorphaceae bacterium]
MRFIHLYFTLSLISIHFGCTQEIKPIHYGEDDCHYCQMRIMDPRFGAEAITDKGRAYTFDSAECLLRYLNDSESQHAHLLVTDYAQPRTLVDAASATFVVSEEMPSPMGGNLNAFASAVVAKQTLGGKIGSILAWEQVKANYKK